MSGKSLKSHILQRHVGKNISERWDEKEKKSQVLQLRLILKIKSISHMVDYTLGNGKASLTISVILEMDKLTLFHSHKVHIKAVGIVSISPWR